MLSVKKIKKSTIIQKKKENCLGEVHFLPTKSRCSEIFKQIKTDVSPKKASPHFFRVSSFWKFGEEHEGQN